MVMVPKTAVARSLFLRSHCEVELNRRVGLREKDEVREVTGVGGGGGGGTGR